LLVSKFLAEREESDFAEVKAERVKYAYKDVSDEGDRCSQMDSKTSDSTTCDQRVGQPLVFAAAAVFDVASIIDTLS
jgi:hypothetical protein